MTPAPVVTILPDDPALVDAVYQNGINTVGLTDVPPERWYQLAEAGCRDGAWDAPVARGLAGQFLVAVDQDNEVPLESMTDAVWLVTVTACRHLFPRRALDAGLPSSQGGSE